MPRPAPPDPEALARGVIERDLVAVSRAITLVESGRTADREPARRLLELLLPRSGEALRVGVSGAPGVGKSTLIEALGSHLVGLGRRVAVLAVDPSSSRRGGSILGDKTRMTGLARSPLALIRPSPSRGGLGGVAGRTREAMVVCEAAGFEVLIVESVGVGQAESAVAEMTDFFLLLVAPGAGDSLQSLKRGVLELADAVAVTRADGKTAEAAAAVAADYRTALSLVRPAWPDWPPPVLAVSGVEGTGVPELWRTVVGHRETMSRDGRLEARRAGQARAWMWRLVEEGVREDLRSRGGPRVAELEERVARGELSPGEAARALLELLSGAAEGRHPPADG